MTNWWADAGNTKLAVIWGSNCAENHPGVMQWLNKAVDGGAKILVIDPRKTRTAIWAEGRGGTFIRIRPGTDAALDMGLLRYLIANDTAETTRIGSSVPDMVDWVQLYNYSDAAYGVGDPSGTGAVDYTRAAGAGNNGTFGNPPAGPADIDNAVNHGTWTMDQTATKVGAALSATEKFQQDKCKGACLRAGTVMSYLVARAGRYSVAEVSNICGMTPSEFTTIATMLKTYRPASVMYAMGGTHHS
jgi:formate dehydrogenase major subunit